MADDEKLGMADGEKLPEIDISEKMGKLCGESQSNSENITAYGEEGSATDAGTMGGVKSATKKEIEGDAVAAEDKSAMEVRAALEEEAFADYRRSWELSYAMLSPMLFTHCTPGCIPVDADVGTTLQIHSIKVTALKSFNLPLEVYGVVATRDAVDITATLSSFVKP